MPGQNKLAPKWGVMVIGLLILLLVDYHPSQAAAPQYGGHLRAAYLSGPSSFDPQLGRSGTDGYYWKQMFDTLVGADTKGVSQPRLSLAESWEFPNPKTLVFRLRKGVKFHDGTDFDAEAVKFNVERILDPATGATPRSSLAPIERVEVVNKYRIKFHLKGPWGAALSVLADRGGAMNSPTAVKKWGKEYGFHPVGTGPFKFVEFVSGSQATMEKNKDYWGKDLKGNRLPFLDKVTLKIIKDPAVLSAALQTGELDVAYVDLKDVDKFQKDPKFTTTVFQGAGNAQVLIFNTKMPPMDNVNLRRAVAYAVDPEAINQSAFFGKAIVAKGGMWPPSCWVYNPVPNRPYTDLKKARDFLAKGGKPNGFEMDMITWDSPTMIPVAELLKAMLAQIGIKINIKMFTTGVATEKFFHLKEAPLFSSPFSLYPEPDEIASLCYKSNGYYNAGKTAPPEIDSLIEKGASTFDIKTRKAIYNRINEIILGDVYYLPTLYSVYYAVAPQKVQGMNTIFSWDAKMSFRELWLK